MPRYRNFTKAVRRQDTADAHQGLRTSRTQVGRDGLLRWRVTGQWLLRHGHGCGSQRSHGFVLQHFCRAGIQATVAHQVLALYGRMPKHTPDERIGLQSHVFVLAIAVIGVIKVYALCVQVQGSLRAQWPALDVACQVQGHTPPVRVRLAEFNIPVLGILLADALAPVLQGVLGRQLQPLVGQGVAEVGQEFAAKQRTEGFDRYEVIGLGVAPLPSFLRKRRKRLACWLCGPTTV